MKVIEGSILRTLKINRIQEVRIRQIILSNDIYDVLSLVRLLDEQSLHVMIYNNDPPEDIFVDGTEFEKVFEIQLNEFEPLKNSISGDDDRKFSSLGEIRKYGGE